MRASGVDAAASDNQTDGGGCKGQFSRLVKWSCQLTTTDAQSKYSVTCHRLTSFNTINMFRIWQKSADSKQFTDTCHQQRSVINSTRTHTTLVVIQFAKRYVHCYLSRHWQSTGLQFQGHSKLSQTTCSTGSFYQCSTVTMALSCTISEVPLLIGWKLQTYHIIKLPLTVEFRLVLRMLEQQCYWVMNEFWQDISHLDTIQECDKQTDKQNDILWQHCTVKIRSYDILG